MRFQGYRVKQTILPVSVLPAALSVLSLLLFMLPSVDSQAVGPIDFQCSCHSMEGLRRCSV